ncbi:MAG: hypothetical protein AAB597_01215 [Patescibacteria group bacterium]
MEKDSLIQEIVLVVTLLVLASALLGPFGLFMTDMQTLSVSAGLLVVLGLFVALMWREKAKDEREELHRMKSDRFAFLLGSAGLVALIGWMAFKHEHSPELISILLLMLTAKIVARIWNRYQN